MSDVKSADVPTMEEFNALQAQADQQAQQIGALNGRVMALESGGTQPPQPQPEPPGDVPPQAAAVGYTELVLGPEVTLNKNWKGLDGARLVQNPDGSVTDQGGAPNHWNAHCSTAWPGPNGEVHGVAFGGGLYAEIEWSWENPPSPGYQNVDGWPSWWATQVESSDRFSTPELPNRQNLEFDNCEYMNKTDSTEYNCGIIHWHGGAGAKYSNNDAGISGSAHSPAGTDVTQRHRIGWLWVPATATSRGYIESYFDGEFNGKRYEWDEYGGGGTPGHDDCSPFSCIDAGHSELWFGTGTKNPLTVYSVRVYQRDRSQNLSG